MKPLHVMIGICIGLLLSLGIYEYDTRRHVDNLINDLKSGVNQQASALNVSKAELQQSIKALDNSVRSSIGELRNDFASLDDLRARQLTIEWLACRMQCPC
jgi:hypothetical protein